MNINAKNPKDLTIAYIGGGSRGWAWQFMADLAQDTAIAGTVRLYDIDPDAAKANETIGNRLSANEQAKGKWTYQTAGSLKQALTGADFIIISILPGTFKEMYSDVHEPEKYGIYQSVGDTTGPGGLIRALRTIPMYVVIAEAIRDYAPDAWVINYTNPMALCVRTLYAVFPQIKAFGCCHEVFGTQKLLADMLQETMGVEHVAREEIHVNVMGINHFTWLDRACYKGTDLFPLYKAFSEKYYADGYEEHGDDNWMNNSFKSANRVKFDLFLRYGLIAAAGDRHLAEFMPPWYLKDPDTVKQWKFGLTTVQYRLEDLEKRLVKSKKLAAGEADVELKPSGEEGVLLIKSLLGLGDTISNVNIPNSGQIPNLPLGAVVETNSLFGFDHITPLLAGEIPLPVLALVYPHVVNQEMIFRAAMNKDKTLAFQAFVNDPLVNLDVSDAQKLFEAMLKNTASYLPGWELE